MSTIAVEFFRLSEPRFDEVELEFPADDPVALLLDLPLESDLCHQPQEYLDDFCCQSSYAIAESGFFNGVKKKK